MLPPPFFVATPAHTVHSILFMPADSAEPIILLADDSDDDVTMFRRAFRRAGFHNPVQVVADGEQAIAYLAGEGKFANRAEYPLPTFMLLDLKMPRTNGFEVLDWLRRQISLRSLIVIVLTTSDAVQDINRAYQLGANSFLTKPLHMPEFDQMIVAMHKYWTAFNRSPETQRPTRGKAKNGHQSGSAPK
jgi:CheY-like chemotaxis protein